MILLDTNVLLWLRYGDRRLGARAREAIDRAWQTDDLAVSVVSFWEVGLLVSRGRIRLPEGVPAWRQRQLEQGMVEIPLDGPSAVQAGLLTALHGDPGDRFIVATAMGKHELITSDERILGWPGDLARLDARL